MAYVTDHSTDYDPVFGDYIALLKPRVMSLVVFHSVRRTDGCAWLHCILLKHFLRSFVYCSWALGPLGP